MAKILTQFGGMLRMVAVAIYVPGQIVQHPSGVFGIYSGLESCAIGDTVELDPCTGQVVEVPSASGTTFTVGANVGLDVSAQLAVAASSNDSDGLCGRAFRAKTSGQTVVQVVFNQPNIATQIAAAIAAIP